MAARSWGGGQHLPRWWFVLVLVAALLLAATPVAAKRSVLVIETDVDSSACEVTQMGEMWESGEFFFVSHHHVSCPEEGHPYLTGRVEIDYSGFCTPWDVCRGWGPSSHITADGTWDGYFLRVQYADNPQEVRALLRGTGAYEGMTMRLRRTGDHIVADVW
jgi:hypothetical protein